MTTTFEHAITPRQLSALLACYYGQRPHDEPNGVYGGEHPQAGSPYWGGRTNMGGAVGRMVEGLRDRGYITEYNRYEDFGDKSSGNLTVKGFDALIERLDDLPAIKNVYGEAVYQFAIPREEIVALRDARAEREADMIRQREAKRTADRDSARAARARANAARLVKLRALFAEEGLADNWSDERLVEFADKIASV